MKPEKEAPEKQRLTHVQLRGPIVFEVGPNDPRLWPLAEGLVGWGLVNPWVQGGVDFGFPAIDDALACFSGGKLLLASSGIVLVPPPAVPQSSILDALSDGLPVFLKCLRQGSLQVSLPTRWSSIASDETPDQLTDRPFPSESQLPLLVFGDYDAPVRFVDVTTPTKGSGSLPFLPLLLDAALANRGHDWCYQAPLMMAA